MNRAVDNSFSLLKWGSKWSACDGKNEQGLNRKCGGPEIAEMAESRCIVVSMSSIYNAGDRSAIECKPSSPV